MSSLLTSLLSATPTDASPSSTTSSGSTATPTSLNHSTVTIVATIVPVVVIIAITLWALLAVGGIMHYHSTPARSNDSDAPEMDEKQRDEDEPMMWEVSLESVKVEDYHDALPPLALELQARRAPFYASRGHTSTSQTNISQRKLWRTITSSSSLTRIDTPPIHQAQETVVVAMPSPPSVSPEAKRVDYAIGTRQVLYKGEVQIEEDVKKEKHQRQGSTEVFDYPVTMDMYIHGYIG